MSDKCLKRSAYVPPRALRLDELQTGSGGLPPECVSGSSDAAGCDDGNSALSSCSSGSNAGLYCDTNGSTATTYCNSGGGYS